MLWSCLKISLCTLILSVGIALLALTHLYQIKSSGEVFLENAPGKVSISRETDTGIIHVVGETWKSVAYGQGFACAQNRLWQMEKYRRVARGTTAEIFGEEQVPFDSYMRGIGTHRHSQATWDAGDYPEEWKEIAEAYADGVNDYVKGVSLSSSDDERTGNLLPLEFYIFNIDFEPWTPVDTIAF